MHLRYNITLSLLTAIVLLASSCYKDDQSFEYDKINDIKLETPSTTYTVAAEDVLVIEPKLIETMPTGEEYNYSWTISSTTLTATIVASTKALNLKMAYAPGTYTVIYKVTSKTTGISALARYTVTVNGIYYGGWYVVHNKDGKAKASLIRQDEVIYDNPMEVTNKKTYPGKALSLYYYSSGLLYFFTDQGAYRFNMNDWLELTNTTTTLPGLASPLPFKTAPVFSATGLNWDQYIVAEGGIYAGLGAGAFGTAETIKPFSDRITGDYEMFPGVFSGNLYTTLFYDNKTQRFISLGYLDRTLVPATATPSATFNMANVAKKMIAYDTGVYTSQTAEYYYVMENNTGRYLLSTTSTTTATNPGISQQILNSPEILSATKFATSTLLKQMYYSTNNKVYLYDILANSARLIYTFPSNYIIQDIEILRSTSKRLVIGVNNGSAGEVYYFDIDGLGQFANNTYAKKYTGFGEIAQVLAARGKTEQ